MQRSTQRENNRRIREEIQQTIEQRTCCPLSFCQSTEHKTIEECYHPDKLPFVGEFHKAVSIQCFEVSQMGTFEMTDVINDIKDRYFTEEHITDEQIEILLFRLSIPLWKTWEKTRDEKINVIMERYAILIEKYYYGSWDEPDDEMMDQIDILTMNQPIVDETINNEYEDNQDEDNDPTRIKLLFKESENTNNGYLTEPNEPNTLLECPICYENDCFITTNCRHVFCECILKHIAKSTTTKRTNTDKPQQIISCCPCCREPVYVLEISHKKNYQIISALSEFYTETS